MAEANAEQLAAFDCSPEPVCTDRSPRFLERSSTNA